MGFVEEVEGKEVEEGVGSAEEVVEGNGVEQREELILMEEEAEEAAEEAYNEGFDRTD